VSWSERRGSALAIVRALCVGGQRSVGEEREGFAASAGVFGHLGCTCTRLSLVEAAVVSAAAKMSRRLGRVGLGKMRQEEEEKKEEVVVVLVEEEDEEEEERASGGGGGGQPGVPAVKKLPSHFASEVVISQPLLCCKNINCDIGTTAMSGIPRGPRC
jgi:hypothetical protein